MLTAFSRLCPRQWEVIRKRPPYRFNEHLLQLSVSSHRAIANAQRPKDQQDFAKTFNLPWSSDAFSPLMLTYVGAAKCDAWKALWIKKPPVLSSVQRSKAQKIQSGNSTTKETTFKGPFGGSDIYCFEIFLRNKIQLQF